MEPRWRQFLAGDVLGNSFDNDPAHLLLRLQSHDSQAQEKPFIILLRRSGRLRCIAPFYFKRSPYRLQIGQATLGSLPAIQAQMIKVFGGRGQFIFAADENLPSCVQQIFAVLSKCRSQFDLVCLENIDKQSPIWSYCARAFRDGGRFKLFCAADDKVLQLRFPPTYDEYLATFSAETRRNLRRMTRRLCDQQQARLQRITSPGQVSQFLIDLDTITRDSWEADVHGFRPHTEAQVRYFQSAAELGWLRSYVLTSDNGPIAYELAFQYGNVLYGRKCGYSKKWADFSPGGVLMHLLIEDLYQHNRPQLFDFGPGDEPYKRSFRSNVEQEIAFLYLLPRNRWRLLFQAQEKLAVVYPHFRRLLVASRLDAAVRKVARSMIALSAAPWRWARSFRRARDQS